eukprot:gene12310-5984_t
MLSFPVVSSFREWNKKENEEIEESPKELNEHLKSLKSESNEIENVNTENKERVNEEIKKTPKKVQKQQDYSTPQPSAIISEISTPSLRVNSNRMTLPKTPLFSPIQKSLDVSTYSDNDDFISFFNTILQEQQKINLMNMKLNCVNLFANYANHYTSNKLKLKCNEFEEEINSGKQKIQLLQNDIFEHKEEISDLNSKVVNLDEDLSCHKLKLNEATEKYYTSITELESTMSFHKKILNDLENRALKEDFALDGLISLVSLFFVNTSIIDFPITLISSLLSTNKRKMIAQRIIKLIVLLSMIVYWRNLAMKTGFHGQIGGIINYFFSFCEIFFLMNETIIDLTDDIEEIEITPSIKKDISPKVTTIQSTTNIIKEFKEEQRKIIIEEAIEDFIDLGSNSLQEIDLNQSDDSDLEIIDGFENRKTPLTDSSVLSDENSSNDSDENLEVKRINLVLEEFKIKGIKFNAKELQFQRDVIKLMIQKNTEPYKTQFFDYQQMIEVKICLSKKTMVIHNLLFNFESLLLRFQNSQTYFEEQFNIIKTIHPIFQNARLISPKELENIEKSKTKNIPQNILLSKDDDSKIQNEKYFDVPKSQELKKKILTKKLPVYENNNDDEEEEDNTMVQVLNPKNKDTIYSIPKQYILRMSYGSKELCLMDYPNKNCKEINCKHVHVDHEYWSTLMKNELLNNSKTLNVKKQNEKINQNESIRSLLKYETFSNYQSLNKKRKNLDSLKTIQNKKIKIEEILIIDDIDDENKEKDKLKKERNRLRSRKITQNIKIEKRIYDIKWPKEITQWSNGYNFRTFIIKTSKCEEDLKIIISILSEIILTKQIILISNLFNKFRINKNHSNHFKKPNELAKTLFEIGFEVSLDKRYVRLPDHLLQNYEQLKEAIKKLKEFLENKNKISNKAKMLNKLWNNEEINKQLKNVFNFKLSTYCECFVDDSKKSIYIGSCERRNNEQDEYGICLGYFTDGLSMIKMDRLQFRYSKSESIGFDLHLIHWENGEITLGEKIDFSLNTDCVFENIKKVLILLKQNSSEVYNLLFDYVLDNFNLKFWESLRYILKPSEDNNDNYILFDQEIEFYSKFKKYFKSNNFLISSILSLISGRSPFIIHHHFKSSFKKNIEKNNKLDSSEEEEDDNDDIDDEIKDNPFLNEHEKSINESIDDIIKRILNLYIHLSKQKKEIFFINESYLRNFYFSIEKLISNEINFEKQMERIYEKIDDSFFYKIDDLSLGESFYPIPVINEMNYAKFPNIEYLYKVKIPNKFTVEITCKCETECTSKCPCQKFKPKDGDRFSKNFCSRYCKCNACQNQFDLKYNICSKRITVFHTGDKGWGIRTIDSIEKGEFLCEYTGEVISDQEADRREGNLKHEKDASYFFGLNDKYVLDAKKLCSFARFFNHSCNPNCYATTMYTGGYWPKVLFFSKQKIEPNVELTIDYQYHQSNMVYNVKCLCKSNNCYGTLGKLRPK